MNINAATFLTITLTADPTATITPLPPFLLNL